MINTFFEFKQVFDTVFIWLDQSPMGERGSDYQKESMLRSMENAYRLLSSPERAAFADVARERVKSSPEFDPHAEFDRVAEERHFQHYGREVPQR